nr:MAG TPA: hypothetical protein [Caudoviricetes sp.]
MKAKISEVVRHIIRIKPNDAEKILEYAYNTHLPLSTVISILDRHGDANIFPQGSKPSTIEWDVVDVEFDDAELEAFCRKHEIDMTVAQFRKQLRIW